MTLQASKRPHGSRTPPPPASRHPPALTSSRPRLPAPKSRNLGLLLSRAPARPPPPLLIRLPLTHCCRQPFPPGESTPWPGGPEGSSLSCLLVQIVQIGCLPSLRVLSPPLPSPTPVSETRLSGHSGHPVPVRAGGSAAGPAPAGARPPLPAQVCGLPGRGDLLRSASPLRQ